MCLSTTISAYPFPPGKAEFEVWTLYRRQHVLLSPRLKYSLDQRDLPVIHMLYIGESSRNGRRKLFLIAHFLILLYWIAKVLWPDIQSKLLVLFSKNFKGTVSQDCFILVISSKRSSPSFIKAHVVEVPSSNSISCRNSCLLEYSPPTPEARIQAPT
jgi:hypothetical protein